MGRSLKNFLSSYKTAIALLLIYASGLAIATFIEKFFGTEPAKVLIYYSPLFILLQFLLVLNFIFSSVKHRLFHRKKLAFLFIHCAFIVIFAGAFTTHFFGKEGIVHIREGERTDQMQIVSDKGIFYYTLPFTLELEKFTVKRYPGSSSPASFESDLIIHTGNQSVRKTISMNNVLDLQAYRFFQSSYDPDEKGTILSFNKDLPGRTITYSGYFLLLVGFILNFISKNSRFRQLLSLLNTFDTKRHAERAKNAKFNIFSLRLKKTLFLIQFFFLSLPFYAVENSQNAIWNVIQNNVIDSEHAILFGSLPMQSQNGRIEPVNTFSSEVLRKLYHSDKIGNLNSDQFILSVWLFPEMWAQIPVIQISNEKIAFNHDLSKDYCAYNELFDSNGNYKLQQDIGQIYQKPFSSHTKYEKDLLKLDEKVNIFYRLIHYQLISLFPEKDDPDHQWYAFGDDLSSMQTTGRLFVEKTRNDYLAALRKGLHTADWKEANEVLESIGKYQQKETTILIQNQKIKAELLYNRLDIFAQCKKFYLILGGLLFIFVLVSFSRKDKWLRIVIKCLAFLIFLCLLYHLSGIVLRWYIAGYAPWSNSYETMVYVSLITVLTGIIFSKQSSLTLALATLFGGVILFVAGLNWMNPQITPLVPVLKSPWLMIHVAVIMISYGFFGISFLLGAVNLMLLFYNRKKQLPIVENHVRQLSIINELSLWVGLAFMTIGTFLGAIWANESWGRYWGWDPKETWALITIVIYAVVLHLRLVKKWDNPRIFNRAAVFAFACVLMTYFGVNFLLSGMHSYGG